MNNNTKLWRYRDTADYLRAARGDWQREQVRAMRAVAGAPSPARELRGRARGYAARYMASFANLCARLEAQGVPIERVPGPRGGEWTARYYILPEVR